MRRTLTVVGMLVLVGCGAPGGSDGGSGGGSGGTGGAGGSGGGSGGGTGGGSQSTLSGARAFTVAAVRSLKQPLSDGGTNPGLVQVLMVSDASYNLCSSSGSPSSPMDFATVYFGIADGGAVAPGTQMVGGTPWLGTGGAFVERGVSLPGGGLSDQAYSSAGTVTLTSTGANGHQGSFSVTLTAVDGGATSAFSGTFVAPFCP